LEQQLRKGNGNHADRTYIILMEWTPALIAAAWAVLLGGAGGALTDIGQWYRDLRKPSWQPPDWLFGPAWTTILGLAGWSLYLAITNASSVEAQGVIAALFAANFVLHFLWSPLFFKLQRPDWALAENVFLWLSVGALLTVVPRVSGSTLAGWLIVPYFVWVSFAFMLNWKIVQLNAPFGQRTAESG
jgi:tryptophan-rich sensory protein